MSIKFKRAPELDNKDHALVAYLRERGWHGKWNRCGPDTNEFCRNVVKEGKGTSETIHDVQGRPIARVVYDNSLCTYKVLVPLGTVKFAVEYTDTFGGNANYSWVDRKIIEVPEDASDLTVVRRAKAAVGLSGVPCRREDFGGEFVLYPYGICTVCFINWAE